MAKKVKEYWIDGDGDKIPVDYIDENVKQRAVMVERLFTKALEIEAMLQDFQEQCTTEIGNYLSGIAANIGLSWDEKNTKLMNFDQKKIIEVAIGKRLAFDENLQLAKMKIDQCIDRWSKGASDKIKLLVNKAFQVDQAGNVDAKLVLSLQQYKFPDDEWVQAMELINKATKTVASKTYFRFKQRIGENNALQMVNLSFSSVSDFKQYSEPQPRKKRGSK